MNWTEQHSICFRITLYDPLYYLVVTIHDAILQFHFDIPAERIFDFAVLDACDEVVKPLALVEVLTLALGVVLLISGVLKLQYAVDFLRLKGDLWWVPFAGALVTIGLGALVFFNPFSTMKWLMLFIGISFMINGVWDLVSVLLLSQEVKTDDVIEVEAKELDFFK